MTELRDGITSLHGIHAHVVRIIVLEYFFYIITEDISSVDFVSGCHEFRNIAMKTGVVIVKTKCPV